MKKWSLWISVLFISGCGHESKLTSACEMAVKTILRAPDYARSNKVGFLISGISQFDLEKIYIERASDKRLAPASKRYLDMIYEGGEKLPHQYWIDLKVSSPEIGSGSESNASCRFVDRMPDGFSLVKMSINGKSYSGDGLLNLQVKNGPPNKLTEYLF